MAGGARCLHGAVIHSLRRESRLAAMTQGAFITWHARRRGGWDMVGRLAKNSGIGSRMASLAGSVGDPGVGVGQADRCPSRYRVAIRTVRIGWHMVRRLDVDIRIRRRMAGRTGR